MTQQINLFDPALLRKHDPLNATNLALVAAVLLVLIGAWGAYARSQAGALETQANELQAQLQAVQTQIAAVGKQMAETKPDPRLEAELVSARSQLTLRGDVLAALKKGLGEESPSFADYLRGLARQSVNGLWLTGFVVGDGGEMEIRGRMNNPAQLPEYIRRLNAEKVFQGRAFAALKVSAGQAAVADAAPGKEAKPAKDAPYHEFALTPTLAKPGAEAAAGAARAEPKR